MFPNVTMKFIGSDKMKETPGIKVTVQVLCTRIPNFLNQILIDSVFHWPDTNGFWTNKFGNVHHTDVTFSIFMQSSIVACYMVGFVCLMHSDNIQLNWCHCNIQPKRRKIHLFNRNTQCYFCVYFWLSLVGILGERRQKQHSILSIKMISCLNWTFAMHP